MSSNNNKAPTELVIGDQEERISALEENLKRTQARLVEREKLATLGGLVAGVSHELNTPIGICTTGISKLKIETDKLLSDFKSGALSGGQLEKYLDMATKILKLSETNLRRSADLVQSFKKVGVGQSHDQISATNIGDMLKDTVASLKPKYDRDGKKVHYTIEVDSELVLKVNSGLLFQIVSNLIINSYLHGFIENGEYEIDIEAKLHNGFLKLQYHDNGVGLSESAKKSIFEPFFTTDTTGHGSGLGMSIVHNIVTEKLKGTIKVNHEEDEGFSLKLSIPVDER